MASAVPLKLAVPTPTRPSVRAGRHLRSVCAVAATWLLAHGAHAQGTACDQLKATLAQRLQADPSTYTLQAVPANTPLPPGAKFIGTCEGGAKKVMYRRGNPAPLAAQDTPKAPVPSVAASTAPSPAPVPKAAPVPPAPVSAPAAKPAPSPPATPPAPAPAPVPAPPPVAVKLPAPAPAVASTPTRPSPSQPVPTAALDRPLRGAPVPPPAETPSVDTTTADSDDTLMPSRPPEPEGPSFIDGVTDFAGDHWPWAAGIVLVPLVLGIGAWILRRQHYDAAGLPRGPKL